MSPSKNKTKQTAILQFDVNHSDMTTAISCSFSPEEDSGKIFWGINNGSDICGKK